MCVEPNAKRLIDDHGDLFAFDQEYPVYLYDSLRGEKITEKIPKRFISKSVIQNTFKYLREKDKKLAEINQLNHLVSENSRI